MRTCKVKVEEMNPHPDIPKVSQCVWVEKDALFHHFGTVEELAGSGDDKIAVSVAIVELLDGQVITVEPHNFRFTDQA